jgi:hypothetical protein
MFSSPDKRKFAKECACESVLIICYYTVTNSNGLIKLITSSYNTVVGLLRMRGIILMLVDICDFKFK